VSHDPHLKTAGDAHCGPLDTSFLTAGLLLPTVMAWLYFVVFASSPVLPALYAACKIAQFALPLVWLLLAARRAPCPLFSFRSAAGGFAGGFLLAAGVLSFYLLVLRGSGLAAEAASRIIARLEALHSATPLRFMALALGLSVVHSFLEEYYWRWFAFGRLRACLGTRRAIALSSAAFAAHHVIVLHAFIGADRFWSATLPLSLAVAGAGVMWAWQYARAGSLVPVWISHTLADLAIMAIGYDLIRGTL